MYQNYIFDLYGTLVDIRTDEWQAQLWKKMQLLYNYHGADYSYQEIKRAYGRLVDKEKAAVRRRHPEYTVIDIKIEKVFRAMFTEKGVKPSKALIAFIAEAFRCYSTKLLRLYDGVTDLLALGGMYSDLEEGFGKKLDVLTTQMLTPAFLNRIRPEEVLIYARA